MLEADEGWSINKFIISFTHNNILGYSPTGRGGDTSFTWNSKRDCTPQLHEFERKSFSMSTRVYLGSNRTFCTLDDEFMGSRAQDNQVTTISFRKADVEGHSMTAVADASFCVFFHARFARRGERKTNAAGKLLSDLLENCDEQCLEGIFLTYDRGKLSEEMAMSLLQTEVACICIMKENSVLFH